MTQEERQTKYSETLHFALDEYTEIEKEVKKLGKRITALRTTIKGLSELTGETLFFEDPQSHLQPLLERHLSRFAAARDVWRVRAGVH